MRYLYLVIIVCVGWAAVGTLVGAALAERIVMSLERVVPEDSEIQFLVRGEVRQSQHLQPGTYRITIERIR